MEINNTMDINDALLQLTSFRDELYHKMQAIDVCIAAINQQFAPKFEELEVTKAENDSLKNQNVILKNENDSLKNSKITVDEEIIK